ncbi:Folate transporter 1 [Orchesella cincta]|uniref:Folate transporter 1 n=1 Tax=Orchesella cincta TaxID=48709 RepID=A0A1D2MUS5_ORCCI|nr:Folate transporter 1 [Orchesella cincta]
MSSDISNDRHESAHVNRLARTGSKHKRKPSSLSKAVKVTKKFYLQQNGSRLETNCICHVWDGLFKEFLPSAPFFIEYAMDKSHGNFSQDEITREILPITIYGHFISLLIFLLITDLLRYRPIIILGGLSAMACWTITIYSYHTKRMQLFVKFSNSIEHSSEVAYITFMYEIVNRTFYREVTSPNSWCNACWQIIGGALGQILLSYKLLSLDNMNYTFALGSTFSFIVFAMFMPGNQMFVIHEAEDPSQDLEKATSKTGKLNSKPDEAKPIQMNVRRWSMWWSMSRAIYWQIELYTESLWKEIENESHQHPLNGAVDATHALISSIDCCVVAIHKSSMGKVGWKAIWQSEIASSLPDHKASFIFGINALMGIMIQAVMTNVVTNKLTALLWILEASSLFMDYSIVKSVVYNICVEKKA